MNIELTDAMKSEIVTKTAEMFYRSIRESPVLDEAIKQVKDKICADLASDVAGRFHKRVNVDDLVAKAVADFEAKVNARITKTIEKGIVIKLAT